MYDLLEIKLRKEDDFLKVKETLTRIGVASKKDNTLYQSCHILHKQGRYFIVHFKELFALDGKPSDFSNSDKARRNTITKLLVEWGLVILPEGEVIGEPQCPVSQVKILPHREKDNWELVAKYTIGKRT